MRNKVSKRLSVSAIVPAYNEEKNIAGVLSVLTKSPMIDEVIAVNDGSTDRTADIIRSFPSVTDVSFRKNHGKGHAIASGIGRARGDIVLFIDADLVNLTERHIRRFVNPLLEKNADGVIGYMDKLSDKVFRPLSGERAYFRKDLIRLRSAMQNKGYRLELFLNYAFRDKKIRTFPLTGVKHTPKYDKHDLGTAIVSSTKEIHAVLDEIMRHDNPPQYFFDTYLSLFYLKKLPATFRKKTVKLQSTIDGYREKFERMLAQHIEA
ncbi:MAG TPA: glycosyltransferase [Patescibacteria group bacterium]|nr:glycosyltransferase [Patescibacteria group bacterium]